MQDPERVHIVQSTCKLAKPREDRHLREGPSRTTRRLHSLREIPVVGVLEDDVEDPVVSVDE